MNDERRVTERVVPDYMEPIIAYRVWDRTERGLLGGKGVTHTWIPKQPEVAMCRAQGGGWMFNDPEQAHVVCDRSGVWSRASAPVAGCTCGIYALKNEADLWQQFHGGEIDVWGSVKLWGRIIEHDTGYRAEFAYPDRLHVRGREFAARVADLYGCDVIAEPRRPEVVPVPDVLFGFTGFIPTMSYGLLPRRPGWIMSAAPEPEPELDLLLLRGQR